MTIDHISAIAEQNAAFTAAVSAPGALDRQVPSCPGWTVADLVFHLGEVQAFWTLVLRAGGGLPSDADEAAAKDPGDDLLGWWRSSSAGLVEQLKGMDPTAPSWCWWNPSNSSDAAGVAWRQAHEAVVHRWDAEAAVGDVRPIDPALAADGVDEFVARYLVGGHWSGPSGVVLLRPTDVDSAWRFGCGSASLDPDGGPFRLPDDHDGPPVPTTIVSGTAEQLDLLLWRRIDADPAHIDGDAALLDAFLAWPSLD